jgi:hypothetical protein
MSGSWRRYIDAAHRKIDIAAFNCEQLALALSNCPPPHDGRPDVPTQAFFEGVVVATVSAVDQVTQAANSALGLGLNAGSLFEGAAPEIEKRVPEFKAWSTQPIGRDLRRLRVRMVHHSYCKSPSSNPSWQVESANPDYTESRELLTYARAATAYARELAVIADKLQDALAANSAAG